MTDDPTEPATPTPADAARRRRGPTFEQRMERFGQRGRGSRRAVRARGRGRRQALAKDPASPARRRHRGARLGPARPRRRAVVLRRRHARLRHAGDPVARPLAARADRHRPRGRRARDGPPARLTGHRPPGLSEAGGRLPYHRGDGPPTACPPVRPRPRVPRAAALPHARDGRPRRRAAPGGDLVPPRRRRPDPRQQPRRRAAGPTSSGAIGARLARGHRPRRPVQLGRAAGRRRGGHRRRRRSRARTSSRWRCATTRHDEESVASFRTQARISFRLRIVARPRPPGGLSDG